MTSCPGQQLPCCAGGAQRSLIAGLGKEGETRGRSSIAMYFCTVQHREIRDGCSGEPEAHSTDKIDRGEPHVSRLESLV